MFKCSTMRIRDFQSGPEVAWLISDPPLWPRVQFVGRTVTVLKSIQFQFFLISLKRRISLFSNSPSILRGFQLTEKFLGSFSLVQSVEKFQWLFEREVSRQYNTLSLFTDIIKGRSSIIHKHHHRHLTLS